MQRDIRIPVIVVDDQTVMRIGLRYTLGRIEGVKVVAEVGDAEEVLSRAQELRPAIVFIDVMASSLNAIELTRALRRQVPETRVIMFTADDDEETFLTALQSDADGYCAKDSTEYQLEFAIDAVLQGARWVDKSLARRILQPPEDAHKVLERRLLSDEQKKFLNLIERGYNLKQVAKGNHLTEVKMNLRSCLDSLEPNSTDKPTRLMQNLRAMIDEADAEATSLEKQIKELKSGTIVLDKYRIEKVLGHGGMSVVYLARHTVANNLVAIKIMHENIAANGSSLLRFEREANIATSLNHPSIVGMHEYGEDERGRPYLIMDYVGGDSLEEMIERAEKLDAVFCLSVFLQICDGLKAMHDRSVLHRDLKPGNVIVKLKSGGPQVKLVDLGLARTLEDSEFKPRLTQGNQLFGSPTYMSPEQCLGQEMDFRSDLYSFGCLMYDALTGHPPFPNENSYNTMWQHVNEPPSRLPFLEKDEQIPESLERIVFKLLHKNPDYRYQTAEQVSNDLSAVLQFR